MGAENTAARIVVHRGVLDMNVIDALREVPNENRGLDSLPHQVTGIEVKAQGVPLHHVDEFFGGPVIEGDFAGMNLQGELHAGFVEHIPDGIPQPPELLKALLHHFRRGGRKRVPVSPDGRSGESGYHLNPHRGGGPGGEFHLFDSPASQVVLLQESFSFLHVGRIFGGSADIEMIPPAGNLQAVAAETAHHSAHFLRREDPRTVR